jgi:thiamine pyrophosphokinase
LPIDSRPIDARRAVIVADGDSDAAALVRAMAGVSGDALAAVGAAPEDLAARPLVIGADHGALRAEALGVLPDLVVGDADSLAPAELARLRDAGCRVQLAPSAKDESDTELCLHAAIAAGALHIRLIGALGGPRPEHSVANLLLLGLRALDDVDTAIVTATSVIRRIGTAQGPGRLEIAGAPGDHVSLFAIDSVVEGVTTDGLRFPLRHEPLQPGPARGLSNELVADTASLSTRRGRLLVVHTQRSPETPA